MAVDCCVKVVDWHLGMFHQSDRVVQCAVCSVQSAVECAVFLQPVDSLDVA